MAPVTPTTTKSDAGYVDPHRGVFGPPSDGTFSATDVISTAGTRLAGREGMRLSIWYFSSVSDTDTWDGSSTFPPPKNPVACAWQGDDLDTDKGSAFVTTQGGIDTTTANDAVITFDMENAASSGWLWVLSRG